MAPTMSNFWNNYLIKNVRSTAKSTRAAYDVLFCPTDKWHPRRRNRNHQGYRCAVDWIFHIGRARAGNSLNHRDPKPETRAAWACFGGRRRRRIGLAPPFFDSAKKKVEGQEFEVPLTPEGMLQRSDWRIPRQQPI
jgi:hypothetical protein